MLQLTHLACTNFMSFDSVELDLQDKCYVVKGDNKDDAGQLSNGSGKTSLLDIICITLLGQSLTDRDLKRCVNRHSQDVFFTVSISLFSPVDDINDGYGAEPSTYVITRKVYSNTKPQELTITIDGQPIKDLVTKAGVDKGVDVRAGNQYILESILGLSKDDLLSYFLIAAKSYKGFLSANHDTKVQVIARFSNAKLVDKALTNLKNEKNRLDGELFNLVNQMNNIDGQVIGLNHSISAEAKARWQEAKDQRLAKLIESIGVREGYMTKNTATITELKSKQTVTYDKQAEQALLLEADELGKLTNDLSRRIATLRTKVLGKIQCPKCQHVFLADPKDKTPVVELEAQLTEYIGDHGDLEAAQALALIDAKAHRISHDLEQRISEAERSNARLMEDITREIDEVEQLEATEFKVDHVDEKLKELGAKNKELAEQQASLHLLLNQVTVWLERFELFKFDLVNKPLAVLCQLTNKILQDIGSDYRLEIEGFKRLKSGELRAQFTPVVTRNGAPGEPYEQLSTGERVRVSLACDLALQQLLNSSSHGGLNLYVNDELVGGLDSLGMELVAKAFNKLGKTILIVSHSGADVSYEHTITVVKEGNKSKVI